MALFGVDINALLKALKRAVAPDDHTPALTQDEFVKQYYETAHILVSELLVACRADDSARGGQLARFIHDQDDLNLLMMVLGIMAAQIVAHQPTTVARGMSLEDLNMVTSTQEPWVVGALDQLSAAAENCDFEQFGNIAVDSHIKALVHDRTKYGEAVDFNYIQRAMAVIDQQTLSIIAADALLRLARVSERE